jgi:hypothetical protein
MIAKIKRDQSPTLWGRKLAFSPAQPALSDLRNFIIQNHAGLIVFAAGVPLYTSALKSQGAGRVFFDDPHL